MVREQAALEVRRNFFTVRVEKMESATRSRGVQRAPHPLMIGTARPQAPKRKEKKKKKKKKEEDEEEE